MVIKLLKSCILKKNGQVEELPRSSNLVVGILEDFEYTEDKCHLEPGDTIFTFTDGVTEAMDVNLKMFGDDRMQANLAKSSLQSCQQIIDAMKADVAAFTEGSEQSDDITMLALKRLS